MKIKYVEQSSDIYEGERKILNRHPEKRILSQMGSASSLAEAKKKAKKLDLDTVFIVHVADTDKFVLYG